MASIDGIGSGGGASAALGAAPSLGRQEFLQLLVTQLRNQDPLNPMDDREFISQMAQLSELESTNSLAARVDEMAAAQRGAQALQMVGREVEFVDAGRLHDVLRAEAV